MEKICIWSGKDSKNGAKFGHKNCKKYCWLRNKQLENIIMERDTQEFIEKNNSGTWTEIIYKQGI